MPFSLTVDPNILYLILLFGLWSGVTAAYIPGTGIAELFSAAITIVAMLMLASMPTNWLAVLVLVIGVAGFLVMPFINRRLALLAMAGLVLQAIGSLFLFNGMAVSIPLIAVTIGLSLVYHRVLLLPILQNPRSDSLPDDDSRLIGARGRVVGAVNPIGTVQAGGELWTARSDTPIDPGTEVVVIGREGLVIQVESVKRKRERLDEMAEREEIEA